MDNAQVYNDQLLVANGKAMQAVLVAMQKETESSRLVALQSQQISKEMAKILQMTQADTEMSRVVALKSQKLAEEMRNDSVAMKTVLLSSLQQFSRLIKFADRPFDGILPPWHIFRSKTTALPFVVP